MDARQTPDPRRETGTGADEPVEPVEAADHTTSDRVAPSGGGEERSSGDVITMSLFGAMVIIASLCFVLW